MTEQKKYVGLDLTQCVEDILYMRINKDQVGRIYSNTKNLEETLKTSSKVLWAEHPEKALELARELIAAGKVITPCVNGGIEGYPQGDRHQGYRTPWLDVEKGTQFKFVRKVVDPVLRDIGRFEPVHGKLGKLVPEILAYEKNLRAKELMEKQNISQSSAGRGQTQ